MKERIENETWNSLIWLGGEGQGEASLRRAGCRSEGHARGSGAMDHQDGKARVEDLTLMDQGNGEEKSRLRNAPNKAL